jgi:hypothetical protein
MIETSKQGCRRLGFGHLLNLDEEVEDFAVLGVDNLAVTNNVTTEHFPVSFRTVFHRVLLSGTSAPTAARPLERRTQLFSPLKGAAGSVTS